MCEVLLEEIGRRASDFNSGERDAHDEGDPRRVAVEGERLHQGAVRPLPARVGREEGLDGFVRELCARGHLERPL